MGSMVVARSIQHCESNMGSEHPLIHMGDLADALRRSGASDRSIVRAQVSHAFLQQLAGVISRHTCVPLHRTLFREPHAPTIIESVIPEPTPISKEESDRTFDRLICYAGCRPEHIRKVVDDSNALNELVTMLILNDLRSSTGARLGLEVWLPSQPLFTVTYLTSDEGLTLLRECAGKTVESDLALLLESPSIPWFETTVGRRSVCRSMTMVLSRNLITDGEAKTATEMTLARKFVARYNCLTQSETSPAFVVSFLKCITRLERFARENELRWIKVLHRPIFDDRHAGSAAMFRFSEGGTLRTVEAVDAYENPRFDAHGAFAVLMR